MSPAQLIKEWVQLFNRADAEGISMLYHDDAINHQVANEAVKGKDAIREMFSAEFAMADMKCIVENILESGEWGILEWKDPLGLRGCGIFYTEEGKIRLQRGYWDKLSFLKMHRLPVPG